MKTSQSDYIEEVKGRLKHSLDFYDKFFHRLIKEPPFSPGAEAVDYFMGKGKEARYLAVDGTSYRIPGNGYVMFYGGAFGYKGKIRFNGGEEKVVSLPSYDENLFDQDVSVVAFVPVPYSEFTRIETEESEGTGMAIPTGGDSERIDMSYIHHKVMLLAEIYVAYCAVKEDPTIKVILLDRLLSSLQAKVAATYKGLRLFGQETSLGRFEPVDSWAVLAHPVSGELGLPPRRLPTHRILGVLEVEEEMDYRDLDKIHRRAADKLKRAHVIEHDQAKGTIRLSSPEAWRKSVELFEQTCKRIFSSREPRHLQLEAGDGHFWLTNVDLSFLSAVGFYRLIEMCWEKKVLLLGLAKDSTVAYLINRYLPIIRDAYKIDRSSFDDTLWTDRLFLEAVSRERSVNTPWSTIEFDSIFWAIYEDKKRGRTYTRMYRRMRRAPERLFLKSYVQLFSSNESSTRSHVFGLERLVYPEFDWTTKKEIEETAFYDIDLYYETAQEKMKKDDEVLEVIVYLDRDVENPVQDLSISVLHALTSNKYPGSIGYPDPLYEVDVIAKNYLEVAKNTLKSSTYQFEYDPLSKRFRELREVA